MRPNISEFSYGYALTENLIDWSGTQLSAAPLFPSLIKEGQTGGGYDVNLNFPAVSLFLQFKLAYQMVRRSASEYKQNLFQLPFYRMHLRPERHSQQHNLLREWELQGNLVYYVTPTFHEVEDLNQSYVDRKVVSRSIYIRPSTIGSLPDKDEHHIAFKVDGENPKKIKAYLLSKPKPIEVVTADQLAVELTSHLEEQRHAHENARELIEDQSRRMFTVLESRLNLVQRESLERLQEREPIDRVAYMARMFFNTEMFLVRSRDLNDLGLRIDSTKL